MRCVCVCVLILLCSLPLDGRTGGGVEVEVQQEAIRTGWCGAELVADSQVTAATGAFSLKFEFSGSVQCFPSCGSGRSSRSMWGAVTRLLWEKKTKLWDTNLLQKSRIIWPLWSSNSYYKGAVLCWVFVVFLNVISYFPSQIFRLTVTHRIHPHRSSQSDSSLSRLVHYRGWMMTSSVCVCVCVCVCVTAGCSWLQTHIRTMQPVFSWGRTHTRAGLPECVRTSNNQF